MKKYIQSLLLALAFAASAVPSYASNIVNPVFVQGGTGAVSRTFADKARERRSVMDYGAKGDGVTDDTAAIQRAINALPANGGTVYFPYGKYLVSSELTEAVRAHLVGEGVSHVGGDMGATVIIKSASMTGPVLLLSVNASTVEEIEFRGLSGNTGDGIQISAARVTLRDVSVFAMGNDGIRIGTDTGGENNNLWFLENVRSKVNGRNGITISEGPGALADANAGTGIHLDLQSNVQDGIYLNGAQLNTFVGVSAQSNGRFGYYLSQYASYNHFFGGDPEANTSADIRIDAGAVGNAFLYQTTSQARISASSTKDNVFMLTDWFKLDRGIQFPSVPVPSTDLNTLDDYTESIPVSTVLAVGTTTAGTATYTTHSIDVTKIGNKVFVKGVFAWSGHTGAGNLRITGLPYTANAGATGRTVFPVVFSSYAYGAGIPVGYIEGGTNYIDIDLESTGAFFTPVPLATSGTLYLDFSYTSN